MQLSVRYKLAGRMQTSIADHRFKLLDWVSHDAVRDCSMPLAPVAASASRAVFHDPLFEKIHRDPRWLPFLRKLGKAPEQLAAIQLKVTLPK